MKAIKISQGFVCVVDDEDYEKLKSFAWWVTNNKRSRTFYAGTSVGGRKNKENLFMHRLVLGLQKSDKRQVDHKNSFGWDNRKSNLRVVTPRENSLNSRSHIDAKSKYKGVGWDESRKKWIVTIGIELNKNKFLGRFSDEDTAAFVYNEAAKEFYGEFAVLNRLSDNFVPVFDSKRNKSSKYRGVSFRKRKSINDKWLALVEVGDKKYKIYCDTEIEAAKVYDEMATEYFSEKARLNFPNVTR